MSFGKLFENSDNPPVIANNPASIVPLDLLSNVVRAISKLCRPKCKNHDFCCGPGEIGFAIKFSERHDAMTSTITQTLHTYADQKRRADT